MIRRISSYRWGQFHSSIVSLNVDIISEPHE